MNNALFVAWRSIGPDGGHWGPIGRLERIGDGYRFLYTQGARTLKGFEPFPEMPNLDAIYESDELLPLFANRLLARSRPEYEAYLAWSGFDLANPPDPIAILAVTEGRRATDSLELFPCPTPDEEGCYLNKFFLHGVRWCGPAAEARITQLQRGEQLAIVLEDENESDANAVALYAEPDFIKIGYVPRYLARDVRQLIDECAFMEVTVQRVNPSAPRQQRLLCRMNACWPEGFRPCNDEAFQPIVASVSSPCH
jgi:hypothetical protein